MLYELNCNYIASYLFVLKIAIRDIIPPILTTVTQRLQMPLNLLESPHISYIRQLLAIIKVGPGIKRIDCRRPC